MAAVWLRFRTELRSRWRPLLGVALLVGRWAWGLLADDLGTLSEPQVPLLLVALAVPVVLLLVNAVAFVPGRIAARIRPAVVLRSE